MNGRKSIKSGCLLSADDSVHIFTGDADSVKSHLTLCRRPRPTPDLRDAYASISARPQASLCGKGRLVELNCQAMRPRPISKANHDRERSHLLSDKLPPSLETACEDQFHGEVPTAERTSRHPSSRQDSDTPHLRLTPP